MTPLAILGAVPWGKVIDATPEIIRRGQAVVRALQNGGSLEKGVEDLARIQQEQATLIKTLSELNTQLYQAAKTLAGRQTILLGVSGVSILVAVAALVVAALK